MLPEHWFCPLDPEVADVERPAGVLSVRVLGASQVTPTCPAGPSVCTPQLSPGLLAFLQRLYQKQGT